MREKVDYLSARFSNFQFEYKDPVKNFDRSKVKGLIANLVRVRDPKTATALEVTAGSKMYNVSARKCIYTFKDPLATARPLGIYF